MLNEKLLLLGALGHTLLIAILSFISIDSFPTIGTDSDDKIYHCLAYTVLMLLWYLALRNVPEKSYIFKIAVSCFSYGMIIEVLQGVLATHRKFELADQLANLIGLCIAILIITAGERLIVKKK